MKNAIELIPGLPIYQHWGEVPPGLVLLATIKKAGKQLAEGQTPAAYKQNYRGNNMYYALYDFRLCVPKKKRGEK